MITKQMQARVEHIGRYYLGNGGKEAYYNAGVESGKLAIDAGLLFTGASEFDVLRTGAADVGKAASAAERVGLKGVEVATNVAKADRIAAESSPNIIITGSEPAKPLANSGVPYANAEQAKIGGMVGATASVSREPVRAITGAAQNVDAISWSLSRTGATISGRRYMRHALNE